jgi:hypothetical protein
MLTRKASCSSRSVLRILVTGDYLLAFACAPKGIFSGI